MRGSLQLAVAMTTLSVGACTSTDKLPEAPPFPTLVRAEYSRPYYLQVGDILSVRLMLNPELNEEVTVGPDGHIATTVVRDEVAAGRTVAELREALRRDYSHDLRDPRITVEIKSFAPERFYVGGEVNTPGELISVGPSLTLLQAITRAGGVKPSGDRDDIFIVRRPVAGVPAEYMKVRYSDLIHARDASADVVLAPYDVVYVPRTGIEEVYQFYHAYIGQFANPSLGFSYLINNTAAGAVVAAPVVAPR